MALKIALLCRHQAAKHVLEASQLYLLNAEDLKNDLAKACAEAEWALTLAARSVSEESLAKLSKAESRLTISLRALQSHLKNELKHREDEDVATRLEMLDASENDVLHARRAYNRGAERYNHLLHKAPMSVCASLLGHKESAALIKFEDNHAAQMSKHLMV
ncbi:LemA family protein [Neisseria sp. CCUG12390]|uniref:LemA family protein n=1 Tax=Neisseria sp. CCUG12390 TaxID=3392035 RepID=UPI003A101745